MRGEAALSTPPALLGEEVSALISRRPRRPSRGSCSSDAAQRSHSEASTPPSPAPSISSSSFSSHSPFNSATATSGDDGEGDDDASGDDADGGGAGACAAAAGGGGGGAACVRRYSMSSLLPYAVPGCVAELPYLTARQFMVRACDLPRLSSDELQQAVEVRVRVMRDQRGQAWLVAKDVCALIGKRVGSVGRAISSLNDREKARMLIHHSPPTPAPPPAAASEGQPQRRPLVQVMSVLSVDGLRRLLGRSRCDRAQQLLSSLLADIAQLTHLPSPASPPTLAPSLTASAAGAAASPTSERRNRRKMRRTRGISAAPYTNANTHTHTHTSTISAIQACPAEARASAVDEDDEGGWECGKAELKRRMAVRATHPGQGRRGPSSPQALLTRRSAFHLVHSGSSASSQMHHS